MKYRIAGSVILYNPLPEYLDNIYSYINQVERLYIVNNSDGPIPPVFYDLKNKNAVLIENNENSGIGAALNQALKAADDDGFDLLLTMDQDSKAESSLVGNLVHYFPGDKRTAIVSPLHKGFDDENDVVNSNEAKEVSAVMTSGNLISIEIIKSAGGFNEDLFIDYVDHEICLRLISKGYKVLQAQGTSIKHNLGVVREKNLIFRKVFPTNHPPVRYYYQTRNRFYVNKQYKSIFPSFVKADKLNFIKGLIKLLLFEKSRIAKLKCIYRGYIDYKRNRFGKYAEK